MPIGSPSSAATSEDAFGPLFHRERQPLQRRWLGFWESSLLDEPRRIAGLDPESAAARAGLRNGDEIIDYHGTTMSTLHSSRSLILDDHITLSVKRDHGIDTVQYPSTVDTVPEYRWSLVADNRWPVLAPI